MHCFNQLQLSACRPGAGLCADHRWACFLVTVLHLLSGQPRGLEPLAPTWSLLCPLRQEDKATHWGTGPGAAPNTHTAFVQLTTYATAQGGPACSISSSLGMGCYSSKRVGSHRLGGALRKAQRELGTVTTLCRAGGGGASTCAPGSVHSGPSPGVRTPRCNP